MIASIRKFLVEEDGITAIEYGILAAVVAAAVVAAFSQPLKDFFAALFTQMKTAAGITTT